MFPRLVINDISLLLRTLCHALSRKLAEMALKHKHNGKRISKKPSYICFPRLVEWQGRMDRHKFAEHKAFRKILVSVKIFVRNSGAGNGCANFMGAWKNAFFLQENLHVHKIPRFVGGGVFWVWVGGRECRFYFYGPEDFLKFAEHKAFQMDLDEWWQGQGKFLPPSQVLVTKEEAAQHALQGDIKQDKQARQARQATSRWKAWMRAATD